MSETDSGEPARPFTMYKVWPLKLVLPFRYGRIATGVLLLVLLLPLFYAGAGENSVEKTPALFFSLIIAYIIPVFSFITAKSRESLLQLRPILDLDDANFEQVNTLLDSASRRRMVQCLVAGALSGGAHLVLIHGSLRAAADTIFSSVSGVLTALGTLTVWVIMTTVIVMLIQQSILFGRLGGKNVRVSLLEPRKLTPFARVSIISSLAIIGALALFPLIGLESGLNLAESLPGAIAITGPLIVMFIIPVWPLHNRLVAKKNSELASLDERIEKRLRATGDHNLDTAEINELIPLLSYRREIAQVPTWPFDLGNVTTLLFYLIIPPLTWAGAALIENVVDSLL